MRTLLWFLGVVAVAVALVIALKASDGYGVLVWPPWRVDFSLDFFILVLISAFAAFYALVRLLVHAFRLPVYVRRFRRERRQRKARRLKDEAEIAYAEGRFAKAERLALASVDAGEAPLLPLLLAARAAHAQHKTGARDDYLARISLAPEGKVACLTTRAEFLIDDRDVEGACAVLEELRRLAPRATHVLKLDLEVQKLARNWEALVSLVRELERREAIDGVQAEQLLVHAHVENIARRAADRAALEKYWERLPVPERLWPQVAAAAAQAFVALGEARRAREIIEQALGNQWDTALLERYGELPATEGVKQIERAEKWLASRPQDPELLLVLGRLCMRQGLWGKARSYLEASLALSPSRAARLALGELMEHLGQAEEACRYYRGALAGE